MLLFNPLSGGILSRFPKWQNRDCHEIKCNCIALLECFPLIFAAMYGVPQHIIMYVFSLKENGSSCEDVS